MTLSALGENYPQLHASAYVAESEYRDHWRCSASGQELCLVSKCAEEEIQDQIVIGEETNVQDATICLR